LTAADTLAQLALVALADGRTADAGRLARDAVAAYEGQDAPDGHALARSALARSLLALGRADAALAEANRAQELVGKSPHEFARLTAAITAGRVQGRLLPKSAAQAVKLLEGAEERAATLGMVPLRFEASLALAEIAALANAPDADARLVALEKEARARGFGLVASQAVAARQQKRK